MFKVGDKVRHKYSEELGIINEFNNDRYGIQFDKGWTYFGYKESEMELFIEKLETNIVQEVKSVCHCDSRQLFNFGHDKTCIERKP